MKLNITKILEDAISKNASDLHFVVGAPPYVRIASVLSPVPDAEILTADDIENLLLQIVDDQQREIFEVNKTLDFSVGLGTQARVRVNAFFQKGYPSMSLRVIPLGIPQLEDLKLPSQVGYLTGLKSGLVLVSGPTGHGKSTTIASMVDKINTERAEHIITIEDPIEYIFTNKKSLIEQREMYLDTHSWEDALRSALRQDPNVVVIGEMRDIETMEAALSIAETGHLVFASVHANSASQTIERVISAFPDDKRSEVTTQLSFVLEAVISQRLIAGVTGDLVPAVELLLNTEAVKNLIREDKLHMIDNVISTSYQVGMLSMEKSLANLVNDKVIDEKEAMTFTSRPEILRRLIKES